MDRISKCRVVPPAANHLGRTLAVLGAGWPLLAGAQAGSSASIGALAVASYQAQESADSVRIADARPPLMTPVSLFSFEADGSVSREQPDLATIASGAVLMAQENPGRLIVLDIRQIPLQFRALPESQRLSLKSALGVDAAPRYESHLAARLANVINTVQQSAPGAAIAVRGLPVESTSGSDGTVETNQRYSRVIRSVDALVPNRSILSQDRVQTLANSGLSESIRLADSRPILFRSNGNWSIAISGSAALETSSDPISDIAPARTTDSDRPLESSWAGGLSGSTPLADGKVDSELLFEAESLPPSDEVPVRVQSQASLGGDSRPGIEGLSEGSGSAESSQLDGAAAGLVPSTAGGGAFGSNSDSEAEGSSSPGDAVAGSGVQATAGGFSIVGTGGVVGWANSLAEGPLEDDTGGTGSGLDGDSGPAGSDSPALLPGDGFAGPPQQWDPIGTPNSPGYDAKAIARWNVVPAQSVESGMGIGVVAFHAAGIDRVEFSADGGSVVSVTERSYNPRTGTNEYWVELEANAESGPVEIRAVVVPKVGRPRSLAGPLNEATLANGEHSLYLAGGIGTSAVYVSPTGDDGGAGTATGPFKTIVRAASALHVMQDGDASGGTIYLLEGDHVYGSETWWGPVKSSNGWLTVTPAPGTDPSSVRLVKGIHPGLKTQRVRLLNLQIAPKDSAPVVSTSSGEGHLLWMDGCVVKGLGAITPSPGITNGWAGLFATDCTVSDTINGIVGTRAMMARNCIVTRIGSDAFTNTALVVNCEVSEIDPKDSGLHPDVYALSQGAPVENRIAMNLKAVDQILAQGIHTGGADSAVDIAIINCDINNQDTASYFHVITVAGIVHNWIIRDCSFVGPTHWRPDLGMNVDYVVVENSTQGVSDSPLVPHPDSNSAPSLDSPVWMSPLGVTYIQSP